MNKRQQRTAIIREVIADLESKGCDYNAKHFAEWAVSDMGKDTNGEYYPVNKYCGLATHFWHEDNKRPSSRPDERPSAFTEFYANCL